MVSKCYVCVLTYTFVICLNTRVAKSHDTKHTYTNKGLNSFLAEVSFKAIVVSPVLFIKLPKTSVAARISRVRNFKS